MKDIIAFFKSRLFFINLAAAVFLIAALFGFTYKWLDNYTKHGESISVPDLRGKLAKQLDSVTSNMNLRFAVVDSVFIPDKPAGSIIEQDPMPDAKVKEKMSAKK